MVQYIISKYEATSNIVARLRGCFISLAKNKFGSNVVVAIFKHGRRHDKALVLKELMERNILKELLQHEFGNYVVQLAYKETKVIV